MVLGFGMTDQADGPEALEQRGTLGGRLHVRGQRAWDRRRRTGQDHHQLAADVQTGEVVVMGLGDLKPISGEDERRPRTSGPARSSAS